MGVGQQDFDWVVSKDINSSLYIHTQYIHYEYIVYGYNNKLYQNCQEYSLVPVSNKTWKSENFISLTVNKENGLGHLHPGPFFSSYE